MQTKLLKMQSELSSDATNKQLKYQIFVLTNKIQEIYLDNKLSLGALSKFSKDLTQDRFEDITRRILAGFGLDWSNENSKIDFETFCKIKCFLEFFTIPD